MTHERYSAPRTEEEARKMEAKIASGEASGYDQAETQVEKENDPSREALLQYSVITETSNLLSKDQAAAESFANPWQPERKAYGALPYYDRKDEILGHFAEEAAYFGKHYKTGEGPAWRDPSYAEGVILFEMKFGRKLSEFAEEILANYPKLEKDRQGREISVFGLSGAGKSTALEAVKESLGKDVVVMDSDTVRFNLLGKMIADAELKAGASLDDVRNNLMHNNISGSLYFLLNHVTKELKSRGYDVIQSSTMPTSGADMTLYVEHPDGIDPRSVTDDQIPALSKSLHERTQARTGGADDFDWEHAETVTEFGAMKPVTVQVPERVHGIFIKNAREALVKSGDSIKSLPNPKIDDPTERKEAMKRAFMSLLESGR